MLPKILLNSDGQIVTASSIDFEIAESHEVTVEARTESGLITSNTFEIQVEDDPSDEPSTIEFDFNLSGLFPEIENIIHYQLFFDQPDAFHFENKFPVAGAFWGDVGTSDWVSANLHCWFIIGIMESTGSIQKIMSRIGVFLF